MQQEKLALLGKKLQPIAGQAHRMIRGIFNPTALDSMIGDANDKAEVVNDKLNANAQKEEFKKLWAQINHRYVYTVHYDSEELIKKSIAAIDKDLTVTQLHYVVTTGEQGEGTDFDGNQHTHRQEMREVSTSTVSYDLVGDIACGATLTRRTAVRILKGILPACLLMFKNNPKEFIRKVVRLIKEQKATMIVEQFPITSQQTLMTQISSNRKRVANQWIKPILPKSTFWTMFSLIVRVNAISLKTLTKPMKFVSVPSCHAHSRFLHQ